MYVDEWGTWYDVEPGTNPGFLYQQNTLRDAVVAAVNLNIFHAHADRVRMTNIAQMVNVLQAMILTDKEKMLLTPTYHVFHMYKPFRGATQLPVELEAPQHKLGEVSAPTFTASAARGTRWPAAHRAGESRSARRHDRQHQNLGRDSRKARRERSSRPPAWTRTTPSTNPRP